MFKSKKPKIGLALGSGGPKGLAHLGGLCRHPAGKGGGASYPLPGDTHPACPDGGSRGATGCLPTANRARPAARRDRPYPWTDVGGGMGARGGACLVGTLVCHPASWSADLPTPDL